MASLEGSKKANSSNKALISWTNHHLKKKGKKIQDIGEDFKDGVALCQFLSLLAEIHEKGSSASMGKFREDPKMSVHMAENCQIALDFAKAQGVKVVNIGNQDISEGNVKLTSAYIYALMEFYHFGSGFRDAQIALLKWIQSRIPDYNITGFGKQWNDGRALNALLNSLDPEMCMDHASMAVDSTEDHVKNNSTAMQLALHMYGVPDDVLSAQDIADPEIDELTMVMYLTYYQHLNPEVVPPAHRATLMAFLAEKDNDQEKAAKFYRRALETDPTFTPAMVGLRECVKAGKGVTGRTDTLRGSGWEEQERLRELAVSTEPDPERIAFLEKMAARGWAAAENCKGVCRQLGVEGPRNMEQAFESFNKSADAGFPPATKNYAMALFKGEGCTQDREKGVANFRRAAEMGHSGAQNNLGHCLQHGLGTPADKTEAAQWYQKSADANVAEAQCALGVCYDMGEGVPKDKAKAFVLYQTSAEQGLAKALYNLGLCYEHGDGCDEDHKKAFEAYSKAAEMGHALAEYNLGVCYYNGHGCDEDEKKAAELFARSAQARVADAEYRLGYCYEHGEGVPVHDATAIALYKRAADQGHEEAKTSLARKLHEKELLDNPTFGYLEKAKQLGFGCELTMRRRFFELRPVRYGEDQKRDVQEYDLMYWKPSKVVDGEEIGRPGIYTCRGHPLNTVRLSSKNIKGLLRLEKVGGRPGLNLQLSAAADLNKEKCNQKFYLFACDSNTCTGDRISHEDREKEVQKWWNALEAIKPESEWQLDPEPQAASKT